MPESTTEPQSRSQAASRPARDLLLWAFLALVAVVVVAGLRQKYPSPDLPGTVLLLADGDLDHGERVRQLGRAFAQASAMEGAEPRWVAFLAAVALRDAEGVAMAVAALGGLPPKQVPAPTEREFLHLGDPMLGNIAAALQAEVDGDRARADTKWRQVAVQARMVGNPVAAELAAAAVERLR